MVQILLTLIFLISSPFAKASGGPAAGYIQQQAQARAKAEREAFLKRFTPEERAFLFGIAQKAVSTIDITYKNAAQQYECISAYVRDPRECPQGKDILEVIKKRYAEYRQAYALGNMRQLNQFKTLPGAPPSDIISTPFSPNNLDFAFNEVDWVNSQRTHDEERMRKLVTKCELTDQDINLFYNSRVTQIITTTPVVLLIKVIPDDIWSVFKAKKYLPDNNDVIKAYADYLETLKETRKKFSTDLNEEQLDGLIVYQMLAAQVIQDNPGRWLKTFEALTKKLLPDPGMESTLYWIKNTFFTLNTLFIGCSVGSTVVLTTTGFIPAGFLAAACTTAAAGNAAYAVMSDISAYYELQQEWLSGVRERGAVEAMNTRIKVDLILLAFNLYGMKAITPASLGMKTAPDLDAVIDMVSGAQGLYTRETMRRTLKEFVHEQGMDIVRGEMTAIGLGAYREHLKTQDIDRIIQVSSEILYQYQKTGSYTFSGQADVLCFIKNPKAYFAWFSKPTKNPVE